MTDLEMETTQEYKIFFKHIQIFARMLYADVVDGMIP